MAVQECMCQNFGGIELVVFGWTGLVSDVYLFRGCLFFRHL